MTMRLNNEQIILIDPDILQETHIPQEINTRTDHIKEIEDCLRPITKGRKPVNYAGFTVDRVQARQLL